MTSKLATVTSKRGKEERSELCGAKEGGEREGEGLRGEGEEGAQ